jgi:hypothetical protein
MNLYVIVCIRATNGMRRRVSASQVSPESHNYRKSHLAARQSFTLTDAFSASSQAARVPLQLRLCWKAEQGVATNGMQSSPLIKVKGSNSAVLDWNDRSRSDEPSGSGNSAPTPTTRTILLTVKLQPLLTIPSLYRMPTTILRRAKPRFNTVGVRQDHPRLPDNEWMDMRGS